MFAWGPATRIYLAAGATATRKGFDGLFGLARDRLELEPLSGHVFVFANAQRHRLKLLFWDGSRFWVGAKRLERAVLVAKGRRRSQGGDEGDLAMLIGPIDLESSKRRT